MPLPAPVRLDRPKVFWPIEPRSEYTEHSQNSLDGPDSSCVFGEIPDVVSSAEDADYEKELVRQEKLAT